MLQTHFSLDQANVAAQVKLQHNRNDVTVLGPDNLGQPVLMRLGDSGTAGRKRAEPELLGPEPPGVTAMDEDEGG